MEGDVVAGVSVVDGKIGGGFDDVAKEHAERAVVEVEGVGCVAAEVAAGKEVVVVVVRLACSAVGSAWVAVELVAVAPGARMDLANPIFQAVLCTGN